MHVIAALYRFTRLDEPATLRGPLLNLCLARGVRGALLLAHEGINGTIAGTRDAIDAVLAHMRTRLTARLSDFLPDFIRGSDCPRRGHF